MLHSHRVLWRGLRVAGLPMPGAEHDACGATLVCEVVIQGPDYADRVLQLVVELEQREVAVAVQLLRRAVVLRDCLRSRFFP